jgi:hypothetical protein
MFAYPHPRSIWLGAGKHPGRDLDITGLNTHVEQSPSNRFYAGESQGQTGTSHQDAVFPHPTAKPFVAASPGGRARESRYRFHCAVPARQLARHEYIFLLGYMFM